MSKRPISASILLSVLASLTLSACSKKPAAESAPASSATSAPALAPSSTTASEEEASKQALLARKKGQLDYATMEDTYINDPKAQWASSAKASSTFGEQNGEPSKINQAENIVGKVDEKTWTNAHQDLGLDWVEVHIEQPVNAKEIRFVLPSGDGVQAISKVELIEPDGNTHIVWSGMSEVSRDERGPRTWFVRKFDPTSYKANGAKITFANNLERGYKRLDAVQIVGQ